MSVSFIAAVETKSSRLEQLPTCTGHPSAAVAPPEHSCSLQSPASAHHLCSIHCWVTAHRERQGQGHDLPPRLWRATNDCALSS